MNEKNLYAWNAPSKGLLIFFILVCLIPFLWWLLPSAWNAATNISVTDRRVRINKINGHCTELPIDSIGVISKSFWFGKLTIKTASGVITVRWFKDRNKVFELISQRIISRQAETLDVSQQLPDL